MTAAVQQASRGRVGALRLLALLGACAGLGGLVGRFPIALLAAPVFVAVVVILRTPALAAIAAGTLVMFSGWFIVADQTGILSTPRYVTSAAAAVLLVALSVVLTGSRTRPHTQIATAGLLVAAAIGVASVIASMRLGSTTPLWDGGKAALIALFPIPLMTLLGGRSHGVLIACALIPFGIEVAFAIAQYPQLTWDASSTSLFTVGEATRWWDSRAVFGTFASLGKNAFGNAVALAVPVALVWYLARREFSTRVLLLALIVGTSAVVVTSLSRSAALSMLVGALAVVVGMRHIRALAVVIVLALLATALAVANAADLGSLIADRGFFDEGASTRLQIWNALASRPSAQWLIGEGYGQVVNATVQVGLLGLGNGGVTAAPPTENLYLRFLVEGGVAGLLLVIAAFWSLGAAALATDRLTKRHHWALALRGVTLALITQSMTSDTLYFEQSAAVFWYLCGVIGAGLTTTDAGT